ncbi:hypothetical protein [Agrobacterium radiobacter]|uniref:hypothetical protein n=1 Tax=Agrobacterium radiobacter TaxID=362 RepID=UPI00076130C1|nr:MULTISPECIES: hypothetical protein [Agrobacterium tumefaciens complex]KAB0459788.1 hypothetical protein F7R04_12825 [Agrobacterium tumefaciens]KWT77076.1 hypothetical protein ASH09_12100 [Agrobacterium radiobacter]NIB11130.1 hypothetical protein [Agrobacterium radiobacter]OOO38270.1 hypothetical protein BS628_08950 [Agrobacterium radiobacter]
MTHDTNSVVARQIVAEFRAFKEAYDRYLDRMDDLVCSLDEHSEVRKKAGYLAVGTEHVTRFTLNGNNLVAAIEAMLKQEEA